MHNVIKFPVRSKYQGWLMTMLIDGQLHGHMLSMPGARGVMLSTDQAIDCYNQWCPTALNIWFGDTKLRRSIIEAERLDS